MESQREVSTQRQIGLEGDPLKCQRWKVLQALKAKPVTVASLALLRRLEEITQKKKLWDGICDVRRRRQRAFKGG